MWPFTRKPKPLNPGPINEDWAYGDLAECTRTSGWKNRHGATDGPDPGDTLKVLGVMPHRDWEGEDLWFLVLGGFPGKIWDARSFRKVPPLNSAATAEFSEQIKALKPKGVKA